MAIANQAATEEAQLKSTLHQLNREQKKVEQENQRLAIEQK